MHGQDFGESEMQDHGEKPERRCAGEERRIGNVKTYLFYIDEMGEKSNFEAHVVLSRGNGKRNAKWGVDDGGFFWEFKSHHWTCMKC